MTELLKSFGVAAFFESVQAFMCNKFGKKVSKAKINSSVYIILSVIVLSLSITFVDAFIEPNYTIKVLIKIVLFLIIPSLYFIINKSEFGNFKVLFKFKKKTMLKAVIIGVLIYILIVGGFFLTRNFIDFSNVAGTLQKKHNITAENYLYVSLYISFMNSFLEEFFFRGFGFITLKPHVNRKFAYIFNPTFFAIYHAGMMLGMFEGWALLLMFIGLFAGGCIFNYLNETSENIYTSWVSHMCANFAINTVGFVLISM